MYLRMKIQLILCSFQRADGTVGYIGMGTSPDCAGCLLRGGQGLGLGLGRKGGWLAWSNVDKSIGHTSLQAQRSHMKLSLIGMRWSVCVWMRGGWVHRGGDG